MALPYFGLQQRFIFDLLPWRLTIMLRTPLHFLKAVPMAKRLARKMQLNGWGSVNEYMVGELLEELPRQLLHDLHLYGRCDIQGFATFGMNRMYDPERMYVFGGVEEQIQYHVRVFF